MANTQSNIIYCSCRSIRDQYDLCSGPDNVNSEAEFDGAACYLSVVGRADSSAYQEHVQISALSSYKVRYPQQFACARRLADAMHHFKMYFYFTVEIKIREISATNTFAYAYVCLLRYVSNSIDSYSIPILMTEPKN